MQTQEELQKQKKRKKLSDVISQRVKELDQQFEEVCTDAINADRTRREKYIEAAYILEKKYELLHPNEKEREEKISGISAELTKKFKQFPSIRSDLSRYLPDRYKAWTWNKKESYRDGNVANATFDEQAKEDFKEVVDRVRANPYSVSRGDLQDIVQMAYSLTDKADDVREDTGIDFVQSRTPKINREESRLKNDKSSTGVPALPKDEAIRKLMSIEESKFDELIDDITRLKERTKEYSPNDIEIHRNLIKGIESFILFIKPYIDKTWHASIPQWVEILTEQFNIDLVRRVEVDYRKLAKQCNIQSKHYSQEEILKGLNVERHENGLHPLQDLQDYIDPDTGKLERLKLTDKQINALKALDVMRFISKSVPFFVAIDEYNRASQQGHRQKRKKKVSPKLSNA